MAAALCFLAVAQAQEPLAERSERPVIGLVLGGGGALGLAHVGVIAELEKAGVEPDIVVGTSMGAVIGSLYAAGYTAEELEKIVSSADWASLFRDGSARGRLAFRRKEEELVFPTTYRFGVANGRLKLPRGLIQGRRLQQMIVDLASARTLASDFDDLPRRFRAVATDIETFEPVVLGDGDLASAVFASMAVPGLLPPQKIGDKTLIDGGLSSNVPIHVARSLGADLLIVVNLSTEPKRAEDIKDVIGVVGQIAAYLTLEKAKAEMATLTDKDVLLAPDLKGFSATDFDKGRALMERGRLAAQRRSAAFERIADLQGHPAPPPASAPEPAVIASIRIENDTDYPDRFVAGAISQPMGAPLDYAKLERDLDDLYGSDSFSNVSYRLEANAAGGADLVIQLSPKDIGDTYARFGLTLATDFQSDAEFNILAGVVRRNLNRRGGEARGLLRIGDDPRLFAEFYQPTDARQTWFLSASADVSRDLVRQFDSDTQAFGEFRVDAARFDIAAGRVFDRVVEVRAGLAQEWGRIANSVGFEFASPFEYEDLSFVARVSADSFDNAFFPTRGALAGVEYRDSLGADDSPFNRSRVGGSIRFAAPLAGGVFVPAAEFGFALDPAFVSVDPALPISVIGFETLGGPLRLSGLPQDSLRGRHKTLVSLAYYRNIAGGTEIFGRPVYVGATLEAGNVFTRTDEISFSALLYGGSVFLGAPTPIGPVFLGVGYTEGGDSAAYLQIGRTF